MTEKILPDLSPAPAPPLPTEAAAKKPESEVFPTQTDQKKSQKSVRFVVQLTPKQLMMIAAVVLLILAAGLLLAYINF